jgi:hypothetical protein
MSEISTHSSPFVPSPTGTDYLSQDERLLDFGKEQSSATPRLLGAIGDDANRIDYGPNNFRYFEAELFSTKKIDFINTDLPMTDENFFNSIKNKPGLTHNVITFNRKHNIRSFDFILTYKQLNLWAADVYKPIPITKQFRGSFIFSGCSTIFNTVTAERRPLVLAARYELIGDSMGEDDSLDEFGGTKGGPKILLSYTYDEDNIYVYLSGLFPYRINPVGSGKFQDISIGNNTGNLTYEEKPKKLIEENHLTGMIRENQYERNGETLCEVYLSLRDTTISSTEGLSTIPINEIDLESLQKNTTTLSILPSRNEAIKNIGFSLANDVNTEVASDIHPIRFGNRALDIDKDKINNIAFKIGELIKDAAISVNKVPFIINENIRFHGQYSVTDEYFIDNNADSFGRLYIKEIGYYDAIKDNFNITSYFFDFDNGKSLGKSDALKEYLKNASPEYSQLSSLGETSAVIKCNKPLYLMKSFEFVDSADYQKYQDITYIQSHTGLVKNAFIELADSGIQNDYDKIIYFSYNDSEDNVSNIYKDIKIPQIIVCNFKDYDMEYITKRNIFNNNENEYLKITFIASCHDKNSEYSNKYFIGTSLGVFFEMHLDEDYVPTVSPSYHNPFIHNDNILDSDDVFDSEAIVNIITDEDYVYFIGETKFALYDLALDKYIQIDPAKYSIAFGGKKLSLVKRLNESSIIFVSDTGLVVYDILSQTFTSKNNNFKYNLDFKDNYASNFNNINYNFEADDIINASSIQLGQFVYLIGARNITKAGNVHQKLNILTGEISNIHVDSFVANRLVSKPSLCTDGKNIYFIGGKQDDELVSGRYISSGTPFVKYDSINNLCESQPDLMLLLKDSASDGGEGRLGNIIPIMAPNDNSIYIFHPEMIKITDINQNFYNNGLVKISMNGDGGIEINQFDITGNKADLDLVCPLAITWIPVKYNTHGAEFVCLYRVEGQTTYYKYIRFKITYDNNFALEIIENLDLKNSAFLAYAEDYTILDAFYNAKYYNTDNGGLVIFCRDKFILIVGEQGLPEVYAIWNDETAYPDCKSLLPEAEFNYYWKKTGGNKSHLSTHFIRNGEYLVFSGGEGYRSADYFDLNTLSFLKTPRYDVFPDVDINNLILDATTELTQIPSSSLTIGAMSSCTINGDIYIVTSIVTDSLALDNFKDIAQGSILPILLLFKIDTSKKDLAITLVKDLTPAFHRKGLIDTYKFINIYQVGKFIFISGGEHSYYDKTNDAFVHENINTWANAIVYNTLTGDLIDYTSQSDLPDIGLFPLIFVYGKQTIICSDQDTTYYYPVMKGERNNYVVGYLSDNGKQATHWNPNLNYLHLASEGNLDFNYASAVSYGKYGFIITTNTLEIVELDKLLKINQNAVINSTILYHLNDRDKALFKDVFVEGNYLYITGGLHTATTQNDSVNGVNNRVLKFYIPSLLKAYTSGKTVNVPEVIQLASSTIKYFNAYAMTKKQELITVGEIHFINENSQIANERDPFDALIAIKGYVYKNIDKSFVKKNRLFSIEELPDNSPNTFNYHYHAFNCNGREFILVYAGTQTQTANMAENVELYDVELHRWLSVPRLPKVLFNISFNNNTIIGGTEQKEDLTLTPYINNLTLTPNDTFTEWEWVEEEFSFVDRSTGFTETIEKFNAFARIVYPNESIKTLIVAKTDNNLLLFNNEMVKINVKFLSVSTWNKLPPIPASTANTYKVLGAHIYLDGNDEHLLVILYQQNNHSFYVWDYFNTAWHTLFTSVSFGELIGIPDENSLVITNSRDTLQIYGKWRDPQNDEIRLGRIKIKIDSSALSGSLVSIETCGLLSQFNNSLLDNNTSLAYSEKSGNLYFKDKNERLHYVRKDDISFYIYDPQGDNSKADSEITSTTYSKKINNAFLNGLNEAIDIKQVVAKNNTGIYTVFTTPYENDINYKQIYLSYYDIALNTQDAAHIIKNESNDFIIPLDEYYEVIQLPDNIPGSENIRFLLITKYNSTLSVFAVTDEYKVNTLFTIGLEDENDHDVHYSAGILSKFRFCFNNGNVLYQLATFDDGITQLYRNAIDWDYILDTDNQSQKTVIMKPTPNKFENTASSINLAMCVTKNNYLVILADKYFGGINGEYQKRVNIIYVAPATDITVPQCFEQFELPLTIGYINLINSNDDMNTIYLIPKGINSKQPIAKLAIQNKGNIFKYHEIEYIEMDSSSSREVFYGNKEIDINWVYIDNYLYNTIYGIKLSLFSIIEDKIPYSYKVNKATNDLITFTTYGHYIYAINSKSEYGEVVYYLDTIDTRNFKRIYHALINKGSTISTQTFSIPIKGSTISISIDGENIIVLGGKTPTGQVNTKVYSINIKTAIIDVLFTNIPVGVDAVLYESPNNNSVYVFPKNTHNAIILPYNKSDFSPITIEYLTGIQITHILLRGDENKLKVIGKDNENNYLLADFDLLSGEISNLVKTDITNEIKATINNRNHAFIYVKKDDTHVDIYEYNIRTHNVSLINNNVLSVISDGPFKLDGYYERNDFIGLKVENEADYLASFYIFKMIHPYHELLTPCGFSTALGNQIKNDIHYNKNTALRLNGIYEYTKIDSYNLKFDITLERLIVFTSPTIYIDCEELLWSTPFYNGALIAVLFREKTILYYINLKTGKIISTTDITVSDSLSGRKTTESAFIPVVNTKNGDLTTMGNVYLIGGESQHDIYQDIVEIEFVLRKVSESASTLSIYTASIIPNLSIGCYKAKVIQLTNRQFIVFGGITHQHQSPDNIAAKIDKDLLGFINKVESNKVHYIIPAENSIDRVVTTRTLVLIDTANEIYQPKGELKEVFVLSNHLYFAYDKYLYVAEINENRQLSNILLFKEFISGLYIPKEFNFINASNRYKSELNKDINVLSLYNNKSCFYNQFNYSLNVVEKQSKYNDFRRYIFNQIDDNVNKKYIIEPDEFKAIAIRYPSTNLDYEFDLIFEKLYKNVEQKIYGEYPDYTVKNIDKLTVLSRVPCTQYRLAIDKRSDYISEERMNQDLNMAFTFNGISQELVRDDYAFIDDSWQVMISNGAEQERKISIVLDRNDIDNPIFTIYGDDPAFPFKHNLLPLVLTYGELANQLGYRYYLFVDIEGNVVTFDRQTKNFITIDGLEDVHVPYFSGELIIFPSKVTEKGSIGRRIWGYSESNPYFGSPQNDEVSIPDDTLV